MDHHPTNQNNFFTTDMSLTEFTKGQFWQIHPPAFEDLCRRLVRDDTAGSQAQFIGTGQTNMSKSLYANMGGTAVIPVSGPLTKASNFLSFFFGGTSYAYIQAALATALEDDEVSNIMLRMDSPGGVVNGLEDTADMVYEARGKKPILAYADGMMASAAYEIGSAADEIVAGSTAMVGSIGVLMVHEDWSKFNETVGVNVTYLTAGKYKALGNPDGPLSDLARETFQSELDDLYTLFVETVARNREVETSKVLTDMADGRIFIGQKAMDAGLVDRIGNFTQAIERARALPATGNIFKIINKGALKMEQTITLQLLEDHAPDLLTQIRETAATAAAKTAYDDGILAERVRVTEILNAEADAGQTRKAIEDGVAAEAAYKQFYQAEKEKRAKGLEDLKAQAPEPLEVEDPEEVPKVPKDPAVARREWRPTIGPAAA